MWCCSFLKNCKCSLFEFSFDHSLDRTTPSDTVLKTIFIPLSRKIYLSWVERYWKIVLVVFVEINCSHDCSLSWYSCCSFFLLRSFIKSWKISNTGFFNKFLLWLIKNDKYLISVENIKTPLSMWEKPDYGVFTLEIDERIIIQIKISILYIRLYTCIYMIKKFIIFGFI